MFRLIISIIILAVVVTYIIIPLMPMLKKFGKSQTKMINSSFADDIDKNKKEEDEERYDN